VSDGAIAVLPLASYLPHLADAVVASSPEAIVDGAFRTFGGKPVAAGMNIPVTSIRIPLLLGDGGQDGLQGSAGAATLIMRELRCSADHAPATNLDYPGAGHAVFGLPPYYPFFTNPAVGGTAQANALATEQFWIRMIIFLNQLPAHQP
jgi:BAAT / Acyl-CoA thioester hydrolase C terminal